MKIIDLLNKINNGEEVPKKVKFDNTIFEYDKNQKEYNHQNHNGYYETLLYRVMTSHFIDVLLRAEVEVIEENNGIKELNDTNYFDNMTSEDKEFYFNLTRTKLNEVIREVNKLRKEREEK